MKIIKIAKEVKESYAWSFIDLPKHLQEKMLELGSQIDKEDLYLDEAENGIETEPHITVKYGITIDDSKLAKQCLKGQKPGFATLTNSDFFDAEKYDVLKITVKSEDLNEIHNKLNALPHNDSFMDYKAHATIAYLKKGKGKKYKNKFNLNETFEFKEVFFEDSKDNVCKIKLA
jgi:2'-5' RNA ligase